MKFNKWFLFAFLTFFCGSILLTVGTILDNKGVLLLKMVGGIGVICGAFFLILGWFKHTKNNEEIAIEEQDERNKAIRGKAAEMTNLTMTFLLFILLVILLIMELMSLALLMAAIMFASSIIQMLFFGYFYKKM